jgi:hypothetical protein
VLDEQGGLSEFVHVGIDPHGRLQRAAFAAGLGFRVVGTSARTQTNPDSP